MIKKVQYQETFINRSKYHERTKILGILLYVFSWKFKKILANLHHCPILEQEIQ